MSEFIAVSDADASGPSLDSEVDQDSRNYLSRRSLVSLSLASFVPAVSFATGPLILFSSAGPVSWISALLSMAATICVGVSVIHFARRYVASGSLYSYVGEVFRPWARFVTGACLFAGYVMGVSALLVVVGMYVGSFLHSVSMSSALNFGPQAIIVLLTIVASAGIAFIGLDTSIRAAVVLTVISIPIVLVIVGASVWHTGLDLPLQFDFSQFKLSDTLRGAALGMAFLIGFESCAALATETRDARKNVPWAVIAPPLVIGGGIPIFLLMSVPGLIASADHLIAGVSAPAALAANAGLPGWIGQISDLTFGIASVASTLAFVNYGARFAMTLAEDSLLPPIFARLHPRHGTPYVALALVATLSFGLIVALQAILRDIVTVYTATATLVIDLWVVPYILITAGAIIATARAHEFRPGLWVASAIGLVAMTYVLINGVVNAAPGPTSKMIYVMVGTVVTLLVVFAASKAVRKRTSAGLDASAPVAVQ